MWLPPVITTGPGDVPVTLDVARDACQLGDDLSYDLKLQGYTATALSSVEATTGTRLITQTALLRCDRWADLAAFQTGPIQSIVSIVYLDGAGIARTWAAEDWESVVAGLSASVRPALGKSFPGIRPVADAIRVTAIIGYGDTGDAIPPEVMTAMLLMIRSLMDDEPFDPCPMLVNHRFWL